MTHLDVSVCNVVVMTVCNGVHQLPKVSSSSVLVKATLWNQLRHGTRTTNQFLYKVEVALGLEGENKEEVAAVSASRTTTHDTMSPMPAGCSPA